MATANCTITFCLPFVAMLTILKPLMTGSLSAPGFIANTDTVPALYWGSPVWMALVMGCATVVERAIPSNPAIVVLTMYLLKERA